ncbi:Acyl-coenzyme A synthetase/AMP-(fatty) acid ligase [Arboricoccus pini]|uniref:Acyl-coenzyme A synthetase/AMP-(Fatty) acid ligase n=1 Tax=Arboricoccus pini TaxID=1963835 RepID=A0A212R421_9PROT|nr:AMP-binding protein [Arboricoccus pini]SNB66752.1 Acyl-coenzyme A synthetase/AMP-(fatty) acid ligase [Arboricoccus pini]
MPALIPDFQPISPLAPPALAPAACLPLVTRALEEVIAWRNGEACTVAGFLKDVRHLAGQLPERPFVINLWTDRYRFLVGFAAALIRGQTSLLTSDRSPHRLAEIAADHEGAYVLDEAEEAAASVLPTLCWPAPGSTPAAMASCAVPMIPAWHPAAIVFTSGSTGRPVGNAKPFAALWQCSRAAAKRFGFDGPLTASLVGTVPGQHMYGFETTILLPLHANCATFAGTAFFPRDVSLALSTVPAPRYLVTTPFQMDKFLAVKEGLAPLAGVISATAPLPAGLAEAAERAWQAPVLEIFGATEVGSIASRRTLDGDVWQAYPGVELQDLGDERVLVEVPYLPSGVELSDRTELLGGGCFRLIGRRTDIVKRAGRRASLAGLSAILRQIEGVRDGLFVAPPELETNPATRLLAFVVAAATDLPAIERELRRRVEPAFLPRQLTLVSALPRNELGKIPRDQLLRLVQSNPAAEA